MNIYIYIYIGLNLFKYIHKITSVKIILFLNKNTKKIQGPFSPTVSCLIFLKIILNIKKIVKMKIFEKGIIQNDSK
jgi:hypothetical protein